MNVIMKNGHKFDYSLWYYLAGPMSGLPDFNYPAFESAAAILEGEGIGVKSPHTIDHGQHEYYGNSFSGMVCVAMVMRLDSDGVEYGADCGEKPDHPIHSKEAGALPYHVYLKAGYRMLLNCSGIILLRGWTTSKGAQSELALARSLQYPVYTLGEGFLMEFADGAPHPS